MRLTKLSDESLDLERLSICQLQTDRRSEDAADYSIELFTGITKRIRYKWVYASRGPTCNLSRPIFFLATYLNALLSSTIDPAVDHN